MTYGLEVGRASMHEALPMRVPCPRQGPTHCPPVPDRALASSCTQRGRGAAQRSRGQRGCLPNPGCRASCYNCPAPWHNSPLFVTTPALLPKSTVVQRSLRWQQHGCRRRAPAHRCGGEVHIVHPIEAPAQVQWQQTAPSLPRTANNWRASALDHFSCQQALPQPCSLCPLPATSCPRIR